MKESTNGVIVVGGGVFGAAGAWELARRGHAVTLVDPGPLPHPDAASTDISKMVRMDYGHDEFYMDLGAEAMEGWDRWSTGWSPSLFHPDGFLLLSGQAMEPGTFEGDSLQLLRQKGFQPEPLDASAIRERYPLWSGSTYQTGYYNPRAGWAESGALTSWLLDRGRRAGVQLREGTEVTGLLERGSRVGGVVAGSERIEARHVVVAAGAWTPTLLPWLSDVMWAAGQPVFHFQVDAAAPYQAPGFPPWACDISRTGWYGFPSLDDGRVKVANHGNGILVDPRGERVVPLHAEERFRDFLSSAVPDLANRPVVGTRLCLYCDTFDGDLWIDRDPSRDGLVVAAGGSGHGFKFAPVLGGMIADVLEGRPNPWAHRFSWRSLGQSRPEAARSDAVV